MNRRSIAILSAAMALQLSLGAASAATIPLPEHRPETVAPEAFKLARNQLASVRQFDLGKLGIPVEKSLRLAGYAGQSVSKVWMLDAVSPKEMETLLAWYRQRLPGWRLSDHVKGSVATLASPKRSGVHITFARCLGGSFQLFPCGSVVRFYAPPK